MLCRLFLPKAALHAIAHTAQYEMDLRKVTFARKACVRVLPVS